MQKDERDLLPLWIRYHGELFGYANLFIYDNGSCEEVLSLLHTVQRKFGVCVEYDRTSWRDFENKGDTFGQQICAWSQNKAADFYFPLDCDEFVAVRHAKGYTCRPEHIHRSLRLLKPQQDTAIAVSERLDNSWQDETIFFKIPRAKKLFFGNTKVAGLSVGFHKCQHPSAETASNIVYFHFHNRPYRELVRLAKDKLFPRLQSQDTDDHQVLRSYEGRGSHLVQCITSTEEDYATWLQSHSVVKTEAVKDRFAELGCRSPWSPQV
jgi:hypothetical protein